MTEPDAALHLNADIGDRLLSRLKGLNPPCVALRSPRKCVCVAEATKFIIAPAKNFYFCLRSPVSGTKLLWSLSRRARTQHTSVRNPRTSSVHKDKLLCDVKKVEHAWTSFVRGLDKILIEHC